MKKLDGDEISKTNRFAFNEYNKYSMYKQVISRIFCFPSYSCYYYYLGINEHGLINYKHTFIDDINF